MHVSRVSLCDPFCRRRTGGFWWCSYSVGHRLMRVCRCSVCAQTELPPSERPRQARTPAALFQRHRLLSHDARIDLYMYMRMMSWCAHNTAQRDTGGGTSRKRSHLPTFNCVVCTAFLSCRGTSELEVAKYEPENEPQPIFSMTSLCSASVIWPSCG